MSSSNNLFIAAFSLLFSLSACSKEAVVIQGEPDHSLDAWIPQDTAEFLCRYSRGSFPNWALWPAFDDYLLPDEKSAVVDINQRLIAQIPPSKRPKYIAVRAFIAQNTKCLPVLNNGLTAVQKDAYGNMGFEFNQVVPVIPNIPDIPIQNNLSFDDQVKLWMRSFQNAWNGDSFEHKVQIVIFPDNDGKYYLRSNVRSSYAAPLNERDFRKLLDADRLDEAREKLAILCAQDKTVCRSLTPLAAAAAKYQKSIADRFAEDVEFTIQGMKNIATTGNTSYTAIELDLTSRAEERTYSKIVFRTDEAAPQYCTLQSERSNRDDMPLELMPGQTAKAWCALKGTTKPWTRVHFWIAN